MEHVQDAPGEAVFSRCGNERFIAGDVAGGPWSPRHCHGGAPAALLAQIAARPEGLTPMSIARITFDLLGPVPVAVPLQVARKVVRSGKKMTLVALSLSDGTRELATAMALKVRDLPDAASSPPANLAPDASSHEPMPSAFASLFSIVPVAGGFGRLGPASVWFRLNARIVSDEENFPTAALIAAADFSSGIAAELPFPEWSFPSLDLTLNISRPPLGDWIRLDAAWQTEGRARTVCLSRVSDVHGEFAHSAQTVFIERSAKDQ